MILEADSIELSFDNKKILYGVYLKAETGKITGILGRNGCGKTCLLLLKKPRGIFENWFKNVRSLLPIVPFPDHLDILFYILLLLHRM